MATEDVRGEDLTYGSAAGDDALAGPPDPDPAFVEACTVAMLKAERESTIRRKTEVFMVGLRDRVQGKNRPLFAVVTAPNVDEGTQWSWFYATPTASSMTFMKKGSDGCTYFAVNFALL